MTQGPRLRSSDRPLQLRYIVSDTFDYSKKICRDGGPRYAESLGLPWSGVRSMGEHPGAQFVIDSDLDGAELDAVRAHIESESSVVLLKVTDPCWPGTMRRAGRAAFVRLVEDCCRRQNVGILSMHEPREWLQEVVDLQQPKLLVLPYPYLVDEERPLSLDAFSARLDRAILSGAHERRRYPLRAKLRWRRLLSKRLRERVDVLEHPGYPEAGEPPRHAFLFADFVAYLARYRYCFLCPSRADLELLKFTECAYAGCVPVGRPASSIPREARDAFLDIDELLESTRAQSIEKRAREHFYRAQTYRQIMSACRRPDDLREQLARFVQTNF